MKQGLRTFLFTPADDSAKIRKALRSGVDAVVLDLEDAVPPGLKNLARRQVQVMLGERESRDPAVIVRINPPGTEWGNSDIEVLTGAMVDAIIVPKIDPRSLELLPHGIPPIIGLVETAIGVENALATASDQRVVRLMLGSADLAADVGSELRQDELDLIYPRARVAMASAAAGLEGPIDVVHLDTADDTGLAQGAKRARSLGFTAKACIHPRQIPVVREIFTPTCEEVNDARKVVEAYESAQASGSGVVTVGTKLVDLPVLRRARQTLSTAERYRPLKENK